MNNKVIAFLMMVTFSMILFTSTASAATHTVTKGETLYSISKKYNTTITNIKKQNNLKSNNIKIGQKLSIPGKAVTKAAKTPSRDDSDDTVAKTIRVTSTAYTANCGGCSGVTATGINLKKNPDLKVIAVDPNVIPLGTKVWVEGYGYAVAGDTGGSIKGNKIDVFMANKSQALSWGRRTVTVKVLK